MLEYDAPPAFICIWKKLCKSKAIDGRTQKSRIAIILIALVKFHVVAVRSKVAK